MAFTRSARKALRKTRSSRVAVVDPYLRGDTDRHLGKSENDNPYATDSDDATDWLIGYQEAMNNGFQPFQEILKC